MIALLVLPILANVAFASTGTPLPKVDVERTCVGASGGDGVAKCIEDENYARRKLKKYWRSTSEQIKRQCVSSPLPPYPSYMVLRDCINNYKIIRETE